MGTPAALAAQYGAQVAGRGPQGYEKVNDRERSPQRTGPPTWLGDLTPDDGSDMGHQVGI